jgi:multisubunit Na+/H+ antiporter MnhC subunit
MTDITLVLALGCFLVAAILGFLRHAYVEMPLPPEPEPSRSPARAFVGSIATALVIGAALVVWATMASYP